MNHQTPLVSVVMATHNDEPFIAEAVHSILGQSYEAFELIIIEDACSDGTADFLKTLNDPRVRIIHNQENLGLTRSLNIGIQLARGEYIARQDADDISLPERLAVQVEWSKQHPDIGVIAAQAVEIDASGHETKAKIPNPGMSPEDIAGAMIYANCFVHSGIFAKKEVLLAAGTYDESYRYAQDYELWLRLLSQGIKMQLLPEILIKQRVHALQITRAKNAEQARFALKARCRHWRLLRYSPAAIVVILQGFLYQVKVALSRKGKA